MKFRPAQLLVVTLLGSLLTGCAPDSLNNIEATGFNAYLKTLQNECKDFYIGQHNIQEWLQYNGMGLGDEYTYWLDMTSRLYYNRIDFAQYRSGVEDSLGNGAHNNTSFTCISSHLPANRPERPKGSIIPL